MTVSAVTACCRSTSESCRSRHRHDDSQRPTRRRLLAGAVLLADALVELAHFVAALLTPGVARLGEVVDALAAVPDVPGGVVDRLADRRVLGRLGDVHAEEHRLDRLGLPRG